MNIGESNALNVVLDRLFDGLDGVDAARPRGGATADDDGFVRAVELLARSARKALGAGWGPEQAAEAATALAAAAPTTQRRTRRRGGGAAGGSTTSGRR
jgi:hypothetical protein